MVGGGLQSQPKDSLLFLTACSEIAQLLKIMEAVSVFQIIMQAHRQLDLSIIPSSHHVQLIWEGRTYSLEVIGKQL
jgi:hypothetical protein